MRSLPLCLILLLGSWQGLWARSYQEIPELAAIFQREGLPGTFILLDGSSDTVFVSDKTRAEERFIPVKSVEEVLPYGGKPQRFKAWEHDMNLRDAIKVSNVAIYQELARRIGLDRMRAGVKKLGYGNMEIGDVVDHFWLDGPLAISAIEQTEFLNRLVEGKLPVSAEALRAVKEITLLEKTEKYELHGKTGWSIRPKQLGWWVGWVERDGRAYPFALNLDMTKDEDATKRIPIGRSCLKALDKL